MLRENDRCAEFPVDLAQQRQKISSGNGIKLCCRFVQHQHTRLHRHDRCKAQKLLLTTGKLGDILIKPVFNAEEGGDLCHPAANGWGIISQALQAESQLMPHFVGDHLVFRGLENIADLLCLFPLAHVGQEFPLIADLTGE